MLDVVLYFGLGCGVLILVSLFFMYEGEEKNIVHALDNWWAGMDEIQPRWDKQLAWFARKVAFSVTVSLNSIFGSRLLTLRFAALSFLLSYASYNSYLWIYYLFGKAVPNAGGGTDYCIDLAVLGKRTCVATSTLSRVYGEWADWTSSLVIILITVAAFRWIPDKVMRLRTYALCILGFSILPAAYTSVIALIYDIPRNHYRLLSGPLINCLSIASDAISIITTRRILRRIKSEQIALKIPLLILLDVLLLLVLIVGPILISGNKPEGDWFRGCFAIAGSNLSTVLVTVFWISFAGIMLTHKLFWPLCKRAVWGVRSNIFRSRTHLLSVGALLISASLFGMVLHRPDATPWLPALALSFAVVTAAGITKIITKADQEYAGLKRGYADLSEQEQFDVFISHASEDKAAFVAPLAQSLADLGLKVFYDDTAIKPGDSIHTSIDAGLRSAKIGVVVLSPFFFEKKWTQDELDGLSVMENLGRTRIIPIWYKVNEKSVARFSPLLAGRRAYLSTEGVEAIAKRIQEVFADNSRGPGSRVRC